MGDLLRFKVPTPNYMQLYTNYMQQYTVKQYGNMHNNMKLLDC